MVDLPKYLRSKSQKLLGAIETVLNLPVTLERQLNGENNLNGSTTRSLVRRRSSRREEENEYENTEDYWKKGRLGMAFFTFLFAIHLFECPDISEKLIEAGMKSCFG